MKMSTLIMMEAGLAGALALSAVGCDQQEAYEDDNAFFGPNLEPRPGTISGGGGWGCQSCDYTNSPHCGAHGIGRVATGADASPPDIKIAHIEDPSGNMYGVEVVDDEFFAQTPAGLVHGGALVGWTLVFSNGLIEFTTEVTAFEYHGDWVTQDLIPTYGLAYEDITQPEPELVNVCPGFIPDETSVVLIADELYDETTRTVIPGQPGWTTLACQGHALAKMKFAGYDPNDQYGSVPENRQATLKMFTADYCGGGQPFTIVGKKLQWVDALAHFTEQMLPYLGAVEARWTDAGAECLDEPRHVARSEVEAVCDIPTCDGDPDIGGADWVTLLP